MANAPDHLKKRHDEVVATRTKLETDLQKLQAKLRDIDRQGDSDGYAAQLAKVNAVKAEIGRVSAEHVDLERAIALVQGGTNHQPAP